MNFTGVFDDLDFFDCHPEQPYLVKRPMLVETFELHGPPAPESLCSPFLARHVYKFSNTLCTFILTGRALMTPLFFCELLRTLGLCPNLQSLTLPNPVLSQPSTQSTFSSLGGSTQRPVLKFLQLVSAAHRNRPRLHAAFMLDYAWLRDQFCPFDLRSVKELVVGSAAPMEVLLPTVKDSLVRLEFCVPFDTQQAWDNFGELIFAPASSNKF